MNPTDFLKDPTGNRRFWVIQCEAINYNHGLDMQQIWAEVLQLYKAGESWILTQDQVDALNIHNEGFQEIDPIDERIRSFFPWNTDAKKVPMTTTAVCIKIGIQNPTTREVRSAGRSLRLLCNAQPKKNNGNKVFYVPNKEIF